jgi:type I restriction enzyme S subunit
MACLSETGMSINVAEVEPRDKATSVKFRNGDVLLARITPCLENGKTAYVNFLGTDEVACGSTEFIVLRGRQVSPYFTYCLARTHDFRENAIKSMIGSSGRQRVQVSCFDEFGIGLPPKPLLDQFDEFAASCFSMITNLQRQNEQLMRARDLLLPRLMNGEIAV